MPDENTRVSVWAASYSSFNCMLAVDKNLFSITKDILFAHQ